MKAKRMNTFWLTPKQVSVKLNQIKLLIIFDLDEMHNLNSFVRDFYFFKRSQYPQISLVHKNPNEAFFTLQKQAFTLQFVELGKVID